MQAERGASLAVGPYSLTRHGLPGETVQFGYGFDLNSTASRKNPMAALEAFQLAPPADQNLSAPALQR